MVDLTFHIASSPYMEIIFFLGVFIRGAFGKFLAWSFISVTDFTDPIMFGIILKSYLSSMFWHNFHEDIIMQTRKKYYCEYMYWLYTGKRKISVENITFYLLKSVQNINNSSYT